MRWESREIIGFSPRWSVERVGIAGNSGSSIPLGRRGVNLWEDLENSGGSHTALPGTGSRPIAGATRCRARRNGCRSLDEQGQRIRGRQNKEAAEMALARAQVTGDGEAGSQTPAGLQRWLVAKVCSASVPPLVAVKPCAVAWMADSGLLQGSESRLRRPFVQCPTQHWESGRALLRGCRKTGCAGRCPHGRDKLHKTIACSEASDRIGGACTRGSVGTGCPPEALVNRCRVRVCREANAGVFSLGLTARGGWCAHHSGVRCGRVYSSTSAGRGGAFDVPNEIGRGRGNGASCWPGGF